MGDCMTDAMECGTTHPQGYIHLLLRHVRARQVHACLNADEALAGLDHLRRKIGRPSPRIPSRRSQHALTCARVLRRTMLYL